MPIYALGAGVYVARPVWGQATGGVANVAGATDRAGIASPNIIPFRWVENWQAPKPDLVPAPIAYTETGLAIAVVATVTVTDTPHTGSSPPNIGYRTYSGGTDLVNVTLGNLASSASLPETLLVAGRITALTADSVLAFSPGYDPLDLFLIVASGRFAFYDGAGNANDGPVHVPDTDFILVYRMAAGTPARWSIATHNGTSWSAFTHFNSASSFANRTYASSGNIGIGGTPTMTGRLALFAKCSTSLSDDEVSTLTSSMATWQGLTSLTNLWRLDQTPVVDLKGTSTQASISGTTVTAAAFPLPVAGSGGSVIMGYTNADPLSMSGSPSDATWLSQCYVAPARTYLGTAGAVVTKMWVYGNNTGKANVAIYEIVGGVPTTRISSPVEVQIGSAFGWYSQDCNIPLPTVGTRYGAAIEYFVDESWDIRYLASIGAGTQMNNASGTDLPSTWSSTGVTDAVIAYYAEVTEGAPSGPNNYNETGRSVPIAASVTSTASAHYKEAAAGAAPFTDDFNRADGAPGSGWAHGVGSFTIASNRLARSSGDGSDFARFTQDIGSPDMFAEADVYHNGASVGGGGNPYACLNVREDSNFGQNTYMGYYNPTGEGGFGSTWSIGKMQGGSFSSVGYADATGEGYPTPGSKIRLEVQGSALRLYLGAVLKVSTTDTSITTGNYAGVNCNYVTPPATFDNFTAGVLPAVFTGGPSVTIAASVTSTDTIHVGSASYNETGKSIPIAATVTAADVIHRKELGLSVPVAAVTTTTTETAHYKELTLAVPVTATTTTTTDRLNNKELALSIPVAATTTLAVDQTDYDELALAITVAGTVTVTDIIHVGGIGSNETGRQILITATTVMSTDQADYDELALSIPGVGTTTATTKQAHKELGLAIPVVATTVLTDLLKLRELGLSATVAGTTAVVDQADFKDPALSILVVATTTLSIDRAKRLELGLSVPTTATVTLTIDKARYRDLPVALSFVGFVTAVDLQTSSGHYDETQRSILVTATTTMADQADYDELALSVSSTGTVTPADVAHRKELSLAVPVTATLTCTSVKGFHDLQLVIPVVATAAVTTVAHFRDLSVSIPIVGTSSFITESAHFQALAHSIPIGATTTLADESVRRRETSLAVPTTASVTSTTRASFRQLNAPVDITSTVTAIDSKAYLSLVPLAILIIANVKVTDSKSRTGVIKLNDADAVRLGSQVVSRVYVGASQVWP